MSLHVPTMLVTAIVSALLVSLVLTFTPRHGQSPGIREATRSALCFVVACILILLKDVLPDDLRIVPLNAAMWMGFAMQWGAYARFDGRAGRAFGPVGVTAGAIALFAVAYGLGADYRSRAIYSSLMVAGLAAGSIGQLWVGGAPVRERARLFVIALSVVTLLCQVLRIGLLMQSGDGQGALLSGTLEQSVAFFPAVFHVLGAGLGFLGMHLERNEAEAQQAARIDPLTGCANRRAFALRVGEELARLAHGGGSLAILVADIDHFKAVNDTHGHAMGDRIIQHFGCVLRTAAGPEDLVARLGGEEFCLLLRGGTAASAERLGRRIGAQLREVPLDAPGGLVRVTASFGVAAAAPGEGWEALFSRADRAMYSAKREGRDRVVVAPPPEVEAPAGVHHLA